MRREDVAADVIEALIRAEALPEADRVDLYNEVQRALGRLVSDVSPDPAVAPQLLPIGRVRSNDYNPNAVAHPEMDLLEQSIKVDGVTMAVVVVPDEARDEWIVVDGFHRRTVIGQRLGRRYLPASVIDRPIADRMASTVRHNRARGRHQVDLMAALVRGMIAHGWDDARVADALGMSAEEFLRLRQMVGAARLLAGTEYSRSWGTIAPPDDAP